MPKRLFLPLVLPFLLVLLQVPALWCLGQSRAHKKKPAPKTHLEYSLDTVMQKLNDLHVTLNRINDFQNRNFDTVSVRKQLPRISSTLNEIQNNLEGNTVLEYKKLLLFEYMVNDIQDLLEEWRTALFNFNSDLVKMNAETEAFAKDTVLRQLIHDSIYRTMYLDEIHELAGKWQLAKKNTATSLVSVTSLQTAVSKPYFQTIDLLSEIDREKKAIAGRLFAKEYPYLWTGDDKQVSTGSLVLQSFRSEKSLTRYFLQQNWGYYIYAFLIGLLFFFWVWYNFRRLEVNPDGKAALEKTRHPYLQRIPVLASLVIALNILPFFNLNAPTVFTQLGQFLLLIVVSILFWINWPRRAFIFWALIMVLYFLFLVTGTALVPRLNARLWLLALNAGSIWVAWYAVRKLLRHFSYQRVLKLVWVIYIVLNALSIICNVFGRLSLAKIFSNSGIFGLVQVIVLSVFVDASIQAFSIQALASRQDEKTKNLVPMFQRMQKGMLRVLTFLAGVIWVVAFTINLNIYDPLYELFMRGLNHSVKLGSLSFRIGNVLLFILIVYLSNVFQKYVGYLFGTADENSPPQTGKRASKLVMVRLILIIAGFLLAIAASGLPVDRITIVLGALGVGIGLGLQNIVNNLVSGIILIFERPFQIGDYIELNAKKGIVRDIGIRASKLVTEEGTEIIMPNGDLLSGEVINWTIRNSQIRIEVPITVEAGHSMEEISAAVQEALAGHDDLSGDEKPRTLLNTANEKATSFTVLVWVKNIGQIQTIKSEVLGLIYQKLKEKGIKTA
jgi:small-conductance mechanosensitive channel